MGWSKATFPFQLLPWSQRCAVHPGARGRKRSQLPGYCLFSWVTASTSLDLFRRLYSALIRRLTCYLQQRLPDYIINWNREDHTAIGFSNFTFCLSASYAQQCICIHKIMLLSHRCGLYVNTCLSATRLNHLKGAFLCEREKRSKEKKWNKDV